MKHFDRVNKAIVNMREKLGDQATIAYLKGYIKSLERMLEHESN